MEQNNRSCTCAAGALACYRNWGASVLLERFFREILIRAFLLYEGVSGQSCWGAWPHLSISVWNMGCDKVAEAWASSVCVLGRCCCSCVPGTSGPPAVAVKLVEW